LVMASTPRAGYCERLRQETEISTGSMFRFADIRVKF